MNFSYTEEQNLLRDSVRKWVKDQYDFEARRRMLREHQGFDPAHWAQMAELGWLALPFAEEDGGLGGNAIDISVVMEEFGKGLVVEPFLANVVMAGGLLRRAASSQQRAQYVPGIIDGSAQWALAFAEAQGRYTLSDVATTAKKTAGGWVIDGTKAVVLNGDIAGKLLVVARTAGGQRDTSGIGLFVVDAGAQGVHRRAYRTFDGFRAADISLQGVAAESVLGDPDAGFAALEATIDEAVLALCSEAVGAMEALYKTTVDYTKTRKQFGVPIGSFQVLQHRMVDMFIFHEQAKSLMLMAAIRLRDGDPVESRKAASALKAYCGRAGRWVGQQAVQLHGGMGMTDELATGHYFKRLTAVEALFGNEDFHLQRFAALA